VPVPDDPSKRLLRLPIHGGESDGFPAERLIIDPARHHLAVSAAGRRRLNS
jgi:hypothetical protein